MNQQTPEKNEIDLIDYIKIIYKRRWIILTFIIICILYTGISSLRQSKKYEAAATFFPIKYQVSDASALIETQVGIESLIISMLESRKMADRIIEQLDLKKLWKTDSMDDARMAIKGIIKLTLEKNGLIKLSAQTTTAELSARIANAHVDNLEYFNRELNLGARRQIVQVIDRAVIPEKRMPRYTKKKILLTGAGSFMFAVFMIFFIDFIQRSNIIKRLKEK